MSDLERLKREMKRKAQSVRASSTMLAQEAMSLLRRECFKVATSFYAAMSREIRDMVYSLLYQFANAPGWQGVTNMKPGPDHMRRSFPHWQFKKFVGPNFAQEYCEMFYKRTQLQFHLGTFCQPIYTFLLHDYFGYNTVTADFIRSCDLTLNYDLSCDTPPQSSHGDNYSLKQQLDALLMLQQHASVTIRICLSPFEQLRGMDFLITTMGLLMPVIYKLQEKGLRVVVLVQSRFGWDGVHCRELTCLWDMGQTELEKMVTIWKTAHERLGSMNTIDWQAAWNGLVEPGNEKDLALLEWMLELEKNYFD